jgi:gliding motility-associated-like protein
MSVTITQPPAIQVGNSASLPPCNGGTNGSASISNITGGTSPYAIGWSNGQTGATATNISAGIYTATVTDNNGCTQSYSVAVVDAAPSDSLDITGTLCTNDPVVLLTGPNGTGIVAPYQWYDASVAVPGATSYTYSANSSAYNNISVIWFHNGCRYITTNEVITVAQDFGSLPQTNVFTPNEDHANDEFIPFSVSGLSTSVSAQLLATMIDDYELYIYDRWGVLMFKTTVVTDMWDGKTTSGKSCDDGTYYWIAKFKAKCSKTSGLQNIKGFVQLIR